MSKVSSLMVICLSVLVFPLCAIAEESSRSELPKYVPAQLPGGTLTSIGSDSMGGLLAEWVEAYKKHQPDVQLQIASSGSAAAPAALIEGTADLGPMARPMKVAERENFISKYGFEPTQIKTALAAVGVFTAKDNPVQELSFAQLDRVFSEKPQQGSAPRARVWKDLGLSGPFAKTSLIALGRDNGSYLSAYFRQRVLLQEKFVPELMTTSDQASMFKAISMNPGALGYGAVTKAGPGTKLIPVSRKPGSKAYLPTMNNLIHGKYPLSRYLNIYVVREPGDSLETPLRDFLRFVLSVQGQSIVREKGLIPLPAKLVQEELSKLM